MANKSSTKLAPAEFSREIALRYPFRLFRNLERQMSRFLEEPFGASLFAEEPWPMTVWSPACDIYETKDGALRVAIAKREEAKPKQVEVKVK
jgi:hypothetical protein